MQIFETADPECWEAGRISITKLWLASHRKLRIWFSSGLCLRKKQEKKGPSPRDQKNMLAPNVPCMIRPWKCKCKIFKEGLDPCQLLPLPCNLWYNTTYQPPQLQNVVVNLQPIAVIMVVTGTFGGSSGIELSTDAGTYGGKVYYLRLGR